MNTNTLSYYPESPTNLSKDFTKLPSSYKIKASLAVLAILLFFVLYVALVVSLGYLTYYSFIYEITHINKITVLMKIGAIAGSAMLFVFTLKFIFKLKNHKPENRIKLNKVEHENLWAFVNQICNETGAPKPKNIYVDPDVNAYVSYSNIWLSLFLPIKKELTIGLGLVDSLNLTEFKAVITHEFGHFAQRAMKIGSYINSANTIIHDMIFSRDKWDDLLDQWRASDIRLSAAAWIITPVIWIIRQVLSLFYQFLNIMYSSLSREMEFNADKVAVSTTGSEAIVSALWKLDNGFENWNNTINHAYLAAKKKVYSNNLYTHNQIALERNEDSQNQKLNELPLDKDGVKQYFSSSENSKVSMYASHPPNNLREDNAKTPFISCEEDTRSPWILFNNKTQLQLDMNTLIYEKYIQKQPEEFSTIEVFENFIKQETQGKELLEEYFNTFLNRFLHIEKEEELLKATETKKAISKEAIQDLKSELQQLMKPVNEIEKLMQTAVEISNGTTKEISFQFNDKEFKKKNIQEGYQLLTTEREILFNESFKEWDLEFCAIHLALASKVGRENQLLKIYKQQNIIIDIFKAILNTKNHILIELDKIQQRTDVEEHEVITFGSSIKDWIAELNTSLNKIDSIEFTPMSNIDDAQEFKEAIVDGGEFVRASGNIFENGEFNNIMNSLDNAIMHLQRLEQKSIGLILMTHHELHQSLN
ncbi:M48 family metallopeptidase [uncultured Tenacibaculum sp.]|uniref:M48 family metallopeptidase n=1 Tax=uncultured Tenacibaculum sp. TaxID=174713 RepID=UPI0026151DDB|nr:M48 family metallopeptidase [uncultured Tenacibaculum sp.]